MSDSKSLVWDKETIKFATFLFFMYFVQVMNTLPGIPINFMMRSVMKLSQVDAQYLVAATALGWVIKPLWGYISQNFPIFGYRQKTYVVGMSLTASLSWWLLAYFFHTHDIVYIAQHGYWTIFFYFNLGAAAYAFVDVVGDGKMAEEGKKKNIIDALVNFQWIGAGIAGVIVNLLSGYLSDVAEKNFSVYSFIFFIAGFPPLINVALGLLSVKEERATELFPWKRFFGFLFCVGVSVSLLIDQLLLLFFNRHGLISWYFTLPMVYKLFVALSAFMLQACIIYWYSQKPKYYWVISLFLFLWYFNPSVSQASFRYVTEVLKFSGTFLGILGGIGDLFGAIGIVCYFYFLRRYPGVSRKPLLYFSIALGACGLFVSYLYYLPPGYKLFSFIPINFAVVAILSGIFFNLFGAPSVQIPLAVAADISKQGREAITYAWFMSVINFSRITMSDWLGGWFYKSVYDYKIDLASWHFLTWWGGDGSFLADPTRVLILRLFVYISAFFTLLAVPLIWFVTLPERKK
ncbi:MAG: hypothetical protein Q7R73_01035 [bacterium]|nr:hypothetical protein [bacterium]